MKKYILFIALQLFIYNLNAQGVMIQCNTPNCFFTDPNPFQTVYSAIITNGKTASNFTWTHSPTNAAVNTPANGSNTYAINWANTPNTPTRTIKVKVTFTDGTSVENQQNVTIKHIAPITSMTITGGSPSTITSSGSTVSVPCGVATRTVSVPTPFTNPTQTVTYTWSLPSGWSGSSTSNSINVTTNAGGGGIISVTARRTDGSVLVVRTFSMNITRPIVGLPIISGVTSSSICSGSPRTFTASSTNATNFSWTSS